MNRFRIFPHKCASTRCRLATSTRNMVPGSTLTTLPSVTIGPSVGIGENGLASGWDLSESSKGVQPNGKREAVQQFRLTSDQSASSPSDRHQKSGTTARAWPTSAMCRSSPARWSSSSKRSNDSASIRHTYPTHPLRCVILKKHHRI